MAKKVRARIVPGSRVDQYRASKSVVIGRGWTEISPTLANKVVGLEYKGRPLIEIEDGAVDETEPEVESSEAEEAE